MPSSLYTPLIPHYHACYVLNFWWLFLQTPPGVSDRCVTRYLSEQSRPVDWSCHREMQIRHKESHWARQSGPCHKRCPVLILGCWRSRVPVPTHETQRWGAYICILTHFISFSLVQSELSCLPLLYTKRKLSLKLFIESFSNSSLEICIRLIVYAAWLAS